ncbi:MAG: hypothetical protein K2L05_02460 [Muribaculaceae bacterium]|nr:hypothetical protein [Muribaculaceae bacterium]
MKILLKTPSSLRIIADSALARNRQPWFLPDFGQNWRWQRALAFRICKLGKNISPKFAGRYVDAITLLWIAEADGCPALDYMDGAIVCGNWMDLEELPAEATDLLCEITRAATVKNGDIIALQLPDAPEPISINDHISLSLANNEVLSFNIK